MKVYDETNIWFAVGSQHLYGEETLEVVAIDAKKIARFLNEQDAIPASIEYRAILTTPSDITKFFIEAGSNQNCGGVILWMHTFSPAKMWINGLKNFSKPILHLHTQLDRDIPWNTLDMDYMNTNQSAHGGREFGHIMTRLNIKRKVVVGHWQEPEIASDIGKWIRTVAGVQEANSLKIVRLEDNMREVAVTEGDKVAAQIQCGMSINGYGIGDLVTHINEVTESEVNTLIEEYEAKYEIAPSMQKNGERRDSLEESAKIEIGLEKFLLKGDFKAFTTSFESLHGMKQLPGMAVQRLMEKGYGFGGEGDWKVAALVRILKVMGQGMSGGTSFMEDYVYHFHPNGNRVLGAHMLEICPSIGCPDNASIEVHPLGIGGKDDPVRMVFNTPSGEAINVSWVDMGDRFRFIINEVHVENPNDDMPKLPVARALWHPYPNLKTAAIAWILAGGSHHTCFSKDVDTQMVLDLAECFNIETLVIDKSTDIRNFKNEIRWNEVWNLIYR